MALTGIPGVTGIQGAPQGSTTGGLTAVQPTPSAAVVGGTVGGTADLSTANNVTVIVSGTYAGVTLVFEDSGDSGANWIPIMGQREDIASAEWSSGLLAANTVRAWSFSLPGVNRFRVRASTWTNGSAAIIIDPGTFAFEPVVAAVVQPSAADLATLSNVAITATTSLPFLSANPRRKGVILFNDSTGSCYLKYGVGASSTSLTYKIAPGGTWSMDTPLYVGTIEAAWDVANGVARVTEMT